MSLSNLFVGRTNSVFIQLVRYAFVGGLAFLVDFSILYALTDCVGWHYVLSGGVAFIAGLIVNYLLSRIWVFGSSGLDNKAVEFAIFALIGVVGLALNTVFLYVFTDWIGLHYLISKIITTILVFVWNFTGRRLLMNRNHEH